MFAQEKIEAVKSAAAGTWIGKYFPGETQIDRNGEEEVVYFADQRRASAEEAIQDAIAIKNAVNNTPNREDQMSLTATEKKALEVIDELRDSGHGDDDISDAMRDGEYLEDEGISQEVAELVYDHVTMRNRIVG